jgi:hypothetical protein
MQTWALDNRESIRVAKQLIDEIDTAMAEHVLEETVGTESDLGENLQVTTWTDKEELYHRRRSL